MTFRWGCTHEQTAVQEYQNSVSNNHDDLEVMSAGLFIDLHNPFIGATPDGIINCTCCGKGVLEVKCPLCFKEGLPEEETSNFCMTEIDSKWTLKNDHAYYYQVQTQLNICQVKYCDFVVWTKKGVVIERIAADKEFFEGILDNIKSFFIYGMLPEIIGKWYTRKPIADSSGIVQEPLTHAEAEEYDSEDYEKSWCYCNQPSYGTMIGCDNTECSIQWFHCDCLRLRHPPKGKWYCPSCTKIEEEKKHRQVIAHTNTVHSKHL